GIASAFDVTRITLTDQTLGTPHYTAPEGQRDERSDLYSVGCMIYEMLAGVPPFEGSSQQEVIRKHINEPVDFGRIPADCRPLLRWLLDKRADQRPRSASHLLSVLDGIEPVPALAVRACPYCEAEIGVDARKCRYCGEWVADRP